MHIGVRQQATCSNRSMSGLKTASGLQLNPALVLCALDQHPEEPQHRDSQPCCSNTCLSLNTASGLWPKPELVAYQGCVVSQHPEGATAQGLAALLHQDLPQPQNRFSSSARNLLWYSVPSASTQNSGSPGMMWSCCSSTCLRLIPSSTGTQ